MRLLKIGTPILVLIILTIIITAPIGPLPGFFIRGTPTEPPANWPDSSEVDEIRLRIVDGLPRVVIIWMVEHNEDLYVVGSASSGWVQMIGESSPVKMRCGDATYDLVAERVTENLEAISFAYREKYRAEYPDIIDSFPPVTEADDSFLIFRLKRPTT